ncbi:unnamed protein product [Periconia digitata]|uniref:Very long-chain fatty acid transport protein n=1 Tax=Periconia digitata TaxID=1303443 RepID=A0A9W4XL62_9PLEO|nr:unnamed protein product [Periconia digitata]
MQALPYALPTAAACLAYLNARHGFTYDWPMLQSLIRQRISLRLHERRDDINVFYVLEQHAKSADRHRPCIIYQGETWSYAEAYEITLRYGTWLKSKGVKKDEVVAMDFINSAVFIWVWLGLWSIGAKPAFVNYNLEGKPLVHTIRTSTAKLVLVGEDFKQKYAAEKLAEHGLEASGPPVAGLQAEDRASYAFERDDSEIKASLQKNATASATPEASIDSHQHRIEIVFFDKRLENHILTLKPERQPDSERGGQKMDDMAMLIYTSGTTGLPKPAIVSWGKANGAPRFAHRYLPVNKTDTMYTAMPLYHASASVLGFATMLRAGGATSIGRTFSHKTFWPEVRSSKATVIQYVGETCRYLLTAPPSPLDKDHHVQKIFGNGLRPDVWQAFQTRFAIPEVCEFYSATEAPAGLFNRDANGFSAGAFGRNGTIGSFLLGLSMFLAAVDPSTNADPIRDPTTGLCVPAGPSQPGELFFKVDADNIKLKFQGYFGNAKATSSKIIRDVKKKGDAYFRSGDLVRRDADGRWWFVDRMGDTFRWKSENASTAQIADALGKHPRVAEACVYGVEVPHHDGRAGCAAIILVDKSLAPDPTLLADIRHLVDKELPAFARPVWLRFTTALELTGTNKHQKVGLQKEGIDVESVERKGDTMFWAGAGGKGAYEKFGVKELEGIVGGRVKL